MADTPGLITLHDATKKILLKAKKPMEDYDRLLEFVIDGYRELRLRTGNEGVKQVKLTPDDINCVHFPGDFEDFIGLAVPINGVMWYLSPKKNMVLTTSTKQGQETLDSSDGEGVGISTYVFEGYGASGGVNVEGYYAIEWDNRRIRLNANTKTEVILVYVTSGTSTDSETYIPYKYLPVIEAYVMWSDVAYVDGRENVAMYRENLYRRLSLELKESEIDLRHIVQIIRESYGITPRR